jgi:hypothetical protein
MKHPKSTEAYTGGHLLDAYLPFGHEELSSSEDVRFSFFFCVRACVQDNHSPFLLLCC